MKCVSTIAFVLFCLSTTAHGQSISQLFAFACSSSNCPDGTKPNSVIQASDGNLSGTTDGPGGGGIFKLTESGQITVHSKRTPRRDFTIRAIPRRAWPRAQTAFCLE
jgi:hypothetical protein